MTDQPINSKAQLQEMLDSGKITDDEYAQLLEALEDSEPPVQAKLTSEPVPPPVPSETTPPEKVRYSVVLEISLIFCVTTFVIFLYYAVPHFGFIFMQSGKNVPGLTQIFVDMSARLRMNIFFLLPAIIVISLLPAILRRVVMDPDVKRLFNIAAHLLVLFFFLLTVISVLSMFLAM